MTKWNGRHLEEATNHTSEAPNWIIANVVWICWQTHLWVGSDTSETASVVVQIKALLLRATSANLEDTVKLENSTWNVNTKAFICNK